MAVDEDALHTVQRRIAALEAAIAGTGTPAVGVDPGASLPGDIIDTVNELSASVSNHEARITALETAVPEVASHKTAPAKKAAT